MSEPRPEAADLDDDARQLADEWSGAHAQWLEVDKFTAGTYEIWDEVDDRETRGTKRSNELRILLDRISDNLLPYAPLFDRDPIGDGEDAQTNADAVEEFTQAQWESASKAETALPAKQAGKYMIKYGYSVMEAVMDTSDLPEKPSRGDSNYDALMREYEERNWNYNPFRVRAPHPTQVLLPPHEREPSRAVVYEQWRKDALAQYIERRRGEDGVVVAEEFEYTGKGRDLVTVRRSYSREWHTMQVSESVMAAGDIYLQEENRDLLVPFRHAFAGFGDIPSGSEGMNPKYWAQGMLWPLIQLTKLNDQLLSAEAELYMKAAYAFMVTPGSAAELVRAFSGGGNIVGNTDVSKIGFIPVPQLPQFLSGLSAKVEGFLTEGTVPKAVLGERSVGVDTLGQHALMVTVGFKRFVETMEQLSFLTGEIAAMWLKMLAGWGGINGKLTVNGHSLRLSQLQENYHIRASYPLTDEAVKANRVAQGAALVAQKLKSRERHWKEDQGLTNTSGESEQLLLERVLEDPMVVAALADLKLEEQKLADIVERYKRKIAAQQAPVPQDGGSSGGARMPAPPGSEEEMVIRNAVASAGPRPTPGMPGAGQMG